MHIYLPSNFVPERDIVGFQETNLEKYQWIIHTIIDELYKSEDAYQGFVHLKSDILRYFIGERFYKNIIRTLKNSEIIEVDDSYSVGNWSKSYRLKPKFEHEVVKISFDSEKAQGYIDKLNDWKNSEFEELLNNPVYGALNNNLQKIKFDSEGAMQFLNSIRADLNTEQINSRLISIDKLAEKDYFCKLDKSGRVHTNLTNLPRDFRKFIAFEGKKLVQLDIANSQPLLFCPLLKEYWAVEKLSKAPRENKKIKKSKSLLHLEMMENGIPDFINEQPENDYSNDIQEYFILTQKGLFYDKFIELLMKNAGIKVSNRSDFKKLFFKYVFYSTTQRKNEYRYEGWLRKWMPNVYKAIKWHKRGGHNKLAIQLQKTESDIIIKGVCREFMNQVEPRECKLNCAI
jgi:hypothetical protein